MVTQEEARKRLNFSLPLRSEVYYIVQKNKSSAYVRLFVVQNNQIVEISKLASIAIGVTYVGEKGIHRKGTGYGYGTDTVQELNYALNKCSLLPRSLL